MSRSLLLLVLAGVASVGTAWTCSPTKIIDWRASCDKLGSDDEKCKNGPCHRALHYLVEDIVRECYVESGMGDASDLDVYRILDDYCHGETPAPKPTTSNITNTIKTTNVTKTTNATNATLGVEFITVPTTQASKTSLPTTLQATTKPAATSSAAQIGALPLVMAFTTLAFVLP
ncbi:hypothetical protein DYB37_006655 [Aphanomyces astaci]|uniref:Uncharacterized protein n=1 Tax=Aphanomyces astaci TaxID=112090 RepID=A0A3R7BTM4_APHAT|nr:hypothetical protein DYB37_006655 [Aphanomyces astaci]